MDPDQADRQASVTSWLVRWRGGDEEALPQLAALVYAELHRLATVSFREERDGHTLQPTALVHELYLNLPAVRAIDWKCRAQFFSLAARMPSGAERFGDVQDAPSALAKTGRHDAGDDPVMPTDLNLPA
jgi:hypothetical protein